MDAMRDTLMARLRQAFDEETATHILDRCAHAKLLGEAATALAAAHEEQARLSAAFELSQAGLQYAAEQALAEERDFHRQYMLDAGDQFTKQAIALAAAQAAQAPLKETAQDFTEGRTVKAGVCAGCGGPHRFDTSVPSVVWNEVIRPLGVPEYLCTTCIVSAFVIADRSFTATLWGDDFNGVPIEVRVREQIANDAHAIQEENNNLRSALYEAEAAQARLRAERDAAVAQLRGMGYAPYLDRMAEIVIRAEAAEARADAAEQDRDTLFARNMTLTAKVEAADRLHQRAIEAEARADAAEARCAVLEAALRRVRKWVDSDAEKFINAALAHPMQ